MFVACFLHVYVKLINKLTLVYHELCHRINKVAVSKRISFLELAILITFFLFSTGKDKEKIQTEGLGQCCISKVVLYIMRYYVGIMLELRSNASTQIEELYKLRHRLGLISLFA